MTILSHLMFLWIYSLPFLYFLITLAVYSFSNFWLILSPYNICKSWLSNVFLKNRYKHTYSVVMEIKLGNDATCNYVETHTRFNSGNRNNKFSITNGTRKCLSGTINLCSSQVVTTNTFKSRQTKRTFSISFNVNCKRWYIIYFMEYIFCKIQYVGKA